MEKDWDVAEKGGVVVNARTSKGVGKVKEGDVNGVGGDAECFERGRGLSGIYLDEVNEGVDTGDEECVPDNIVGGRLHDGCFYDGDFIFAVVCGHRVSKGGEK